MSKMGVPPNIISDRVLIQGLCINGDIDLAKEYLHFMLELESRDTSV